MTSYINNYKSCMVPNCESSTIKTPNKLFVPVPSKSKMRWKWLSLARKNDAGSLVDKSVRLYCCEDHFDLPNDMENYMEYHLMGSVQRVRMKPGCVPTKFGCLLSPTKIRQRPNILKKPREKLIGECEKTLNEKIGRIRSSPDTDEQPIHNNIEDEALDLKPDFIKIKPPDGEVESLDLKPDYIKIEPQNIEVESLDLKPDYIKIEPQNIEVESLDLKPDYIKMEPQNIEVESLDLKPDYIKIEPHDGDFQDIEIQTSIDVKEEGMDFDTIDIEEPDIDHTGKKKAKIGLWYLEEVNTRKTADKAVQVRIVHKFRSKACQTNFKSINSSSQASESDFFLCDDKDLLQRTSNTFSNLMLSLGS